MLFEGSVWIGNFCYCFDFRVQCW